MAALDLSSVRGHVSTARASPRQDTVDLGTLAPPVSDYGVKNGTQDCD
jgi:hypothetical protein